MDINFGVAFRRSPVGVERCAARVGVCGSPLTFGVLAVVDGDHINLSETRGWVKEAVTVVAARLSAVERAPPSGMVLASETELSALLTMVVCVCVCVCGGGGGGQVGEGGGGKSEKGGRVRMNTQCIVMYTRLFIQTVYLFCH